MKLNEIVFTPWDSENDESLSSLKSFLTAHPKILNTIKDMMMEEEIDGEYYRELMSLKPDFTSANGTGRRARFNSLSEVGRKFTNSGKCAFMVHTTYSGNSHKLDAEGPFLSSCVKLNGKYYRLEAESAEYYEIMTTSTVLNSLKHNLDDVGHGREQSMYYGWLVFR